MVTCVIDQKHEIAVSGADSKDLSSKDKEPFEKQLYKFMREKKTPIKRLPSLGFKEGQFTGPNFVAFCQDSVIFKHELKKKRKKHLFVM